VTAPYHIVIEDVAPIVDGGRYPAKTVVGEHLPVSATVWRDGHLPLTVDVRWTGPDGTQVRRSMHLVDTDLDRWHTTVVATAPGRWLFRLEACTQTGQARQIVTSGSHSVYADRLRAAFGSWYEVFPRSSGGRDADGRPRHGTFVTAMADLPRVAEMGFDVIHLAPIHPIGRLRRKGRANSPTAQPGDPGCPWAIGAAEGGHDAICPDLGDVAGFIEYVAAARELGLEVAMELALQCAPDHPWLTEHPEWFTRRPDGTIACAENPPSVYADIHPLNFDDDPDGLYAEILRLVGYWIGLGVRAFRVDNPHTKPAGLWHRLIWDIKREHPDVIFLAEAFTRPAVQQGLSKLGFTQTYTYFMWRDSKRALVEFGEELVRHADFLRPNLFPSNHDVLPRILHHQGPAMFAIRAALAATLSPSWGIYSGYEICENEPATPDGHAHAAAEKYELRPRDYATDRSVAGWIGLLNRARRRHPALQQLRTLRFHPVDNDALIAYSKVDPAGGGAVLCVVTLDADRPRRGVLAVTPDALGVASGTAVLVDELGGPTLEWNGALPIELDPRRAVAAIYRIVPTRREQP
jgi:starch synthase (maltosyl-transferring)